MVSIQSSFAIGHIKIHIFLLLSRLFLYRDMSTCNYIQLTSDLRNIEHDASNFDLKNFIIYHSNGRHA